MFSAAIGSNGAETVTTAAASAGFLKKARRHGERALQGREKRFGPNHPDTLSSVDLLSVVLMRASKLKEAKKLSERAMEGRDKVLGELHPDTLTSVSHLVVGSCCCDLHVIICTHRISHTYPLH